MPTDHIRYDLLAQQALRGMVQRVLADAAKNGLPGEHHFFISFDTRAPGVRISPRLQAKYPEEMTIVLQHQFWDLIVAEEVFEVGLSFSGVAERLVVPFTAIKGFFDPSVKFGLEFDIAPKEEGERPDEPVAAPSDDAEPAAKPRRGAPKGAKLPAPAASAPGPAPADADAKTGEPNEKLERPAGAEVVRFDRFRKK